MKLKINFLAIAAIAAFSSLSAQEEKQEPAASIQTQFNEQEEAKSHHVHVDEAHEKATAGKYDEALQSLNRAIELNAQSPRAYRMRGNIYFAKKEYDKALADFDQLVRLRPDHALPYISRSVVQFSLKNYGAAVTDINKALTIDPNNEFAKEVREHIIKEATGQSKPDKPKKKVVYHKQLG